MNSTPPIRHNGFTLVEVLVALLVMSIGLLGIGKLVLYSSRANDSAYLRTQATALGYSILDAMRANRQTALNNGYDITSAITTPNPGVACNAIAACTNGTVLAQYDLNQWKTRMLVALGPTADGSVKTAPVTNPLTGTVNATATVTVQWDDTVALQTFGGTAGKVLVTLETVL
jgi:type IV pilus assembly protein PilV